MPDERMSEPVIGHAGSNVTDGAAGEIMSLARTASIEINIADVPLLSQSRDLLEPQTRVYVSHLPGQSWDQTVAASRAVRDTGFDAIPHVPVRKVTDRASLQQLLTRLTEEAGVRELLLIAGDYRHAAGPYAQVSDVLRSGLLASRGFTRISFAGHPEGHPHVPPSVIRAAEREKVALAVEANMTVTLLTQFFFESAPFVAWSRELDAEGVCARRVAGLAGPTPLASMMRFALRCGVGPSIRALGARPGALMKLMGNYSPDALLRDLAVVRSRSAARVDGVHLFGFGGFLNTCNWLSAVQRGRFRLSSSEFVVHA